jgi:type IV secretory pathway VirB10-like protein
VLTLQGRALCPALHHEPQQRETNMSSKTKAAPHDADSPKPLKVGSRVRCTDDGVEGRIVWANALSVKIRWDDGEQVTWRRDSLADRPVEVLDPPDDEPANSPDEPVQAPAPQPATEQATTESGPAEGADLPAVEPTLPTQAPAPEPPVGEQSQAEQPPKATKKRQPKEPTAKQGSKDKKLSALDAAVKVLAGASAPMNCQELIEAMAAKGLWSSPAGRTPAATLYSALLREIQTKGEAARFVKAERGKFALRDNDAQQ